MAESNILSAKVEGILEIGGNMSRGKEKVDISATQINEMCMEMRERERRETVVFNGNVMEEEIKRFIDRAGDAPAKKVLQINKITANKIFIVVLESERDKWKPIGKARRIAVGIRFSRYICES